MNKNQKTLSRIIYFIKPYRLFVLLSLMLALVTVLLTLYTPILIGHAIDCILRKGDVKFELLLPILVKLAITVLLTSLAQWLMNLCNNKITYHVVKDIRTTAFYI